ncbi:MAG: hypothetical protein Q7S74_02675 [Nanoarchaeota archaeon]|nr:hypothetical protein [Nanoarchaeota archaeon]
MKKREFSKGKATLFLLLAAAFIVAAFFLSIFYASSCNTFECFQEAMRKCTKTTYINDEPEATWKYTIEGVSGGKCVIQLELLQAKEGELELDKLKGYSMECAYPRGIATYPEKDLTMCHGRLKEEMQNIIIKKLHNYILDNLEKIDTKLKEPIQNYSYSLR